MLRVGIVGAGLQGKRRASVFPKIKDATLVAVSAEHLAHAKTLADQYHCEALEGWDWVTKRKDLDIILVCTPTHLHEKITVAALRSGKHVLCEKPLARTLEECDSMILAAKETGKVLKCGFNHRHFPAVWEAKEQIKAGKIGKPLFIRSRYGITGEPGREKEWRTDPAKTSGGHLMEQGIHAIDLSRWILGDISQVIGFRETQYWPFGDLEDNAFVILRTPSGQMASIHTTLMQWKNLFSFEIYGEEGCFEIEGLGSSYGIHKLHYGPKKYYKPFETTTTEYRGEDKSWLNEWQEFTSAIQEKRTPVGSAEDGKEAIRIVLEAYQFSDQMTGKKKSR